MTLPAWPQGTGLLACWGLPRSLPGSPLLGLSACLCRAGPQHPDLSARLTLSPGGRHPVCRVPGLEGITHPGQDLPVPGTGVPGGRGPLLGLHHAGGEEGRGRPEGRRGWGRQGGGVPAPQPLSRRPAPHRPTRRPALPQLSALVRAAVEDNTLTIEPVASQTLPAVKVAAVECGRAK